MAYEWIKALHIMAWASWMAGLFYLPRLFVYHAERGEVGSNTSETLKVMEDKLLRLIMTPAMVVTWLTGLWMSFTVISWSTDFWMHVKLLLVIAMTGAHHVFAKTVRTFGRDENTRSGRYYRFANEVPTLLFIGIVILAVIKPF